MSVSTSIEPAGRRGLVRSGMQFEPELLAAIDEIASERGLSRSATTRDLLRRGIAAYRHERDLLERLRPSA